MNTQMSALNLSRNDRLDDTIALADSINENDRAGLFPLGSIGVDGFGPRL